MITKSKNYVTNLQLYNLWDFLSLRRRKQFSILLILMIVSSITEIISLGAILPFLGILTAPERIFHHQLMEPFNNLFNITSADQLLLPITVMFILAAFFAGAIRLIVLYFITRLSFATGADLSIDIYRRTLYQEYTVHISRNSSEVINSIITKTNTVINGIITPTLNLISSIIIIVAILSALIVIDVFVALTALLCFSSLYYLVIQYSKKSIKENSKTIAVKSTQMLKSLNEGLGGIRDVIINGSQEYFTNIYRNADLPLRRASGNNVFIAGWPRYAMEVVGITIIALIAFVISMREGGITAAIPVLGALAFGAQRLLPTLQLAYSSFSRLKGSSVSCQDVLALLNQPMPKNISNTNDQYELRQTMFFNKEITLNKISFHYPVDKSWVLKDVSLKITKGSRVGFLGVTGSGKSTLLDIIMGLLPIQSGELFIDGTLVTNENKKLWQSHISHVPQNLYLSDGTIEENIAFGISKDKVDHKRVISSAKKAQIEKLIEGWEDGYQTFVGERGIRLSGGQRQRIGMARALYRKTDVLVLDEATSALDNETEQAVMNVLDELGNKVTVLIIAHRLTTLSKCDKIIKLNEDGSLDIGSYQEIVDGQR